MEITILKSRQQGKTLIMDYESDFQSWTHVMRPHYVEMYDEPGVLCWFRYHRKPSMSVMYEAQRVIRHNEDGSFEYLKNRSGTGVGIMDAEAEKEMSWIILKARNMD